MVDDPNKTESGAFIDDDYLSADEPTATSTTQKINIKELWAQNPSLKIFAVVAGLAFLLIAYMVFGGNGSDKPNPDEQISAVRSTPDISQTPGTAELPPAYEDAVRQSNEQIAKTAEATGESAIPTPIARPSERIEAPMQVEETDPLSEWRREAESRRLERQQQDDAAKAAEEAALTAPPQLPVPQIDANAAAAAANATPAPAPPPPLPTAPSGEQVQAIAQQLSQSLQTVLETQTPKESVLVSLNIQPGYNMQKYFPPENETKTTTDASGRTVTTGPNGQTVVSAPIAQPPKPIISAGTIAYAQIITEANSDVPGPVLAEIASGPLLGGRAIGTFSVAEKHLVLQFSRIVKDGVEYPVQAFALDPATTLPGVVSEVNNHYFSRIFLPAAAAFIEGFAEAATQKNSDVIVTNGTVITSNQNELDTGEELLKGAKEAGNKLSEVVDEDADKPRTVIVHAGTRIGLLFMNSVVDPVAQQTYAAANGQQQQGPQSLGQAAFNASPYGQAYNAYNAYQQNSQQQTPYNTGGGTTQQGQPIGLYTPQSLTSPRIQPF